MFWRPTLRSSRIRIFVACFFLALCVWFLLYFDSIHQRHKAERFISDLESFQFADAGFTEVRDLMVRHRGEAVQQLAPGKPPSIGVATRDTNGKITLPAVQNGPTCTIQDCTFEIWIHPRTARLPFSAMLADWIYTAFRALGIRSWVLYGRFEISNGKLRRSFTTVGELRHQTLSSYPGLLWFGYEVSTTNPSEYASHFDDNYTIGIEQRGWNVLQAGLVQVHGSPTVRAFDIRLGCLTSPFHSCDRFGELAPSAWADYLAQNSGTHNTRR